MKEGRSFTLLGYLGFAAVNFADHEYFLFTCSSYDQGPSSSDGLVLVRETPRQVLTDYTCFWVLDVSLLRLPLQIPKLDGDAWAPDHSHT